MDMLLDLAKLGSNLTDAWPLPNSRLAACSASRSTDMFTLFDMFLLSRMHRGRV